MTMDVRILQFYVRRILSRIGCHAPNQQSGREIVKFCKFCTAILHYCS